MDFGSERYKATYTCPKCKRKLVREVSYIDPKTYKNPTDAKVSTRTICPECTSIHEFTYTVKKARKKPSLTVHKFKCNGEEIKKRLKLDLPSQGG